MSHVGSLLEDRAVWENFCGNLGWFYQWHCTYLRQQATKTWRIIPLTLTFVCLSNGCGQLGVQACLSYPVLSLAFWFFFIMCHSSPALFVDNSLCPGHLSRHQHAEKCPGSSPCPQKELTIEGKGRQAHLTKCNMIDATPGVWAKTSGTVRSI